MLPVKILVAISAIGVSHANAARAGAYNLLDQEQLLTPAVTEMPYPEALIPVEAINAHVPTLDETPCPQLPTPDSETTGTETPTESMTALAPKTPYPSESSLESEPFQNEETTNVYPTPAPTTPCPPTPVPETEIIQHEYSTNDSTTQVPTTPCPPMSVPESEPIQDEETASVYPTSAPPTPCPSTLVPETETIQLEKTPSNPAPATPFPPTSVPESEPYQNEETAKAYPTSASTTPCPKFTLVPETKETAEMYSSAPITPYPAIPAPVSESLQYEETTKTYPTSAPTTPCPKLTLVPETREIYSSPILTTPCPKFTLVPETKETTDIYSSSAPTAPYPSTPALETEIFQHEKTTKDSSTPAPMNPCPNFTLVPETEDFEETAKVYSSSPGPTTSTPMPETETFQREETEKVYYSPTPITPLPAPESEPFQNEEATKLYPTSALTTPCPEISETTPYTQDKGSLEAYTPADTDASRPSSTEDEMTVMDTPCPVGSQEQVKPDVKTNDAEFTTKEEESTPATDLATNGITTTYDESDKISQTRSLRLN